MDVNIKKTTHLQDITDLTVMAPVRQGLVPGAFSAYSYVNRLRTVLRVLHAVRQASRESAPQRSPFADSIGRFRAIHFFRFAVVPPAEPAAEADPHQLLLNVTFDGGWEPYMRLIWGPLGKLLDLIFCNCQGYPMASRCSFDDYVRWVRGHEVASTFFYADSAATVADMHYLRALEELQYTAHGRQEPDVCAVGLAMTDPPATAVPSLYAVLQAIRVIKALSGLRDYFPSDKFVAGPPQGQDLTLLRFARDLLADLRNWIEQGMFDPGGPFDSLNAGFRHEREWLMFEEKNKPPLQEDRQDFMRSKVQAGIVESYPDAVRHGVLVLARIADPKAAKEKWLAKAPATPDDGPAPTMYRSVAFTYSGLCRLDVPPNRLERLPYEFRAGMDARAGLLGDLRCNHPENWKRPKPNWPAGSAGGAPIDLSTVHVVMQLRAALDPEEEKNSADGTIVVQRFIDALTELEHCGLKVLHVQPMRTNKPVDGEAAGRDHFGFVDGISQPRIPAVPTPSTSFWSDRVKTGDVFLGYANTRGDKPHHMGPADELLDDGTFLVVRKLEQFPKRFRDAVGKAALEVAPDAGPHEHEGLCADIAGRMMGRYPNGDPMIKPAGPGRNDFIYRDDAAGGQCPHRSHVRRANPRTPLPGQSAPRIVRRGMSYVTPAEDAKAAASQGIVFMAYNSSIAEQFEVIQRWLAGGNSSGLSSTHDDPFVGVPEIGQRRIYRYVRDGKVMQVDLGEAPLAEVQWGLYAFVPSIAALKVLSQGLKDVNKDHSGHEEAPQGLEYWRTMLEDEDVRALTWANARTEEKSTGKPKSADEYGLLASTPASVLRSLQDDGRQLSVCGYGKRMTDSGIGLGFLGLDDAGAHHGHERQAPEVNKAIEEEITEGKAFDAAFKAGQAVLAQVLAGYAGSTSTAKGPVDVIEYGRRVLASLCTNWFGLPDERLMRYGTKGDDQAQDDGITRCPGHFLTVSRYVFGPHPTPAVGMPATLHGGRVLKAVQAMLDEASQGKRTLTPLVKRIVNASGIAGSGDLPARTVAGVMLGFPPTVLGNLVTVLIKWIATRELWELQVDLPEDPRKELDALRGSFLRAMAEGPVPYAVWRTAMTATPLGHPKPHEKVIVGLGSAVADGGDPMLMFGGSRDKSSPSHAPHACPGYGMAMGVMLGCVAALLKAGALAPTPDPRVLTLTGLKPRPGSGSGNGGAAASPPYPDSKPFSLS